MAETDQVKAALLQALTERGYKVESDTYATRDAIYLMGDGDLAIALFELHYTSVEAMEAMYQGAWIEGLPPRFAVLPAAAACEADFELLEQMRIIPLLYEAGDELRFVGLDDTLAAHLPHA